MEEGSEQGDYRVVDDLTGEAHFEDEDSSSDEGGEEDAGPSGGGHADVEDDSLHSFEGHQDSVLSVAWSPVHPDLVASGGQDDKAFIWRVGQDAFESTDGSLGTSILEGHTDTVACIAFNCQGTHVATGGMDGLVKVWEAGSGRLVQTLEGPEGAIEWVRWHPKGNVLLAGSDDMTMWMWLALTGAYMQMFAGHSGPVTDGRFSADGKIIVSVGGDEDCSLRVWNPKTGECITTIAGFPFHEAPITCLALHHSLEMAITGAEDGSVRISSIGQSSQHRILPQLTGHQESVEAVGFCAHLPLAASAGVDCCLRVWEYNTCVERATCVHPDVVTRMAWHPTMPMVITGCADGVARCWDLRTGGLVQQYRGHTAVIQDLALSPDGSMLLTGSDDNTAKVFLTAGGSAAN